MNVGLKRKNRLSAFTIKEYGINGMIIAVLFLFGIYIYSFGAFKETSEKENLGVYNPDIFNETFTG